MLPENDLTFLREAAPDLQEYILSRDLYWILRSPSPMLGGGQLPQLTIGNLILSQVRLAAGNLSESQNRELGQLSAQIEKVRAGWLANWRQKAGKEFISRLNLWQQYLRELRGDVRQHAPFYTKEVRVRVILELLAAQGQADLPVDSGEQLQMLDQILRGLVQPGPFIWDAPLTGVFLPEKYWFLYSSPKGS
jgi:hypothetical protein